MQVGFNLSARHPFLEGFVGGASCVEIRRAAGSAAAVVTREVSRRRRARHRCRRSVSQGAPLVADGSELSQEVGVPEGGKEEAAKAEVRHGDGEDPTDQTETGKRLRVIAAVPIFRTVSEDTSRIGGEAGETGHPIPVTVESAAAIERATVGGCGAAFHWLSQKPRGTV
eukprot:CAMPEP_0172166874 /NCGR_PEP_ID=MMETSP1050-20130122/9249_1 /TAXON_ID=233186 /ORGANISM="Cryptomonas curvata, Strain CCAP979/52" /LENGTH=168 /DNA_ID=CAMNT_0012837583 /DNA_START=14 /DNA_END=520 /DNA_ORIENTATION=+